MVKEIEYTRPWLPDYQKQILDYPGRATVVEGTTKCGKSISHIIWLFEKALQGEAGHNFWWVAPVYSQAKIMFRRLKRFIENSEVFTANETELTITIVTGSVIHFKSAEKPDNLYGEDVHAVVMDEFTRMREDAWIAVRSTLTATKGDMKFIGNVKGAANWGYRLARTVESGALEGWKYFKVTAQDAIYAGILDQKEVDAAKAVLPHGVFLELYFGIPNESSADKFFYAFDESAHVGDTVFNDQVHTYLSFDFNYNPICCSVIQHYDECIWVHEVIKLENSNIYSLCDVIKIKYPNGNYIVTGDATGQSNSAMVKDNLNYYRIIAEQLRVSKSAIQVPSVNPKLEDNKVLMNALLEHYPIVINSNKAQPLIYDCKFVRVDNEGKIVKTDRNDPTQQADAADTFRYYCNRFHRNFLNIPKF